MSSLVLENQIKIRHKAKHEDGTIIAQAVYEKIDIGQEVARAGFAEKCTSAGNTRDAEERKVYVTQHQHQEIKLSVPLWIKRSDQMLNGTPRGFFDQVAASTRNRNFTGKMFASK